MIINSRYQLLELLGKGRSSVYLASDLKSPEKKYALKIIEIANLTQDEIDSLKNEFRLLNSLSHPNIVQAYDFGKVFESDEEKFINSYFFLSEYVQGKNLLEYFNPPIQLNQLNEFWEVLNQISQVLYYIHQLGLIHFDIKPENILVNKLDGKKLNVKLIDFGFSALKLEVIKGTPFYISPEIISGKRVDYRTDLYSLGATLYHTICGKPPFYSDNEVLLLKKHLEEKPKELPDDFPEFLRMIISKLLEKDPARRFNNSLEILDYLPGEYSRKSNIWPIPKIYFAHHKELNQLKIFVDQDELEKKTFLIISEQWMGKSFLIKKLREYLDDISKNYFYLNPSYEQSQAYNLLYVLFQQMEILINQKNPPNKQILNEKITFIKDIFSKSENRLEFQDYQRNFLSELLIELAKELKFVFVIDDFHKFDQAVKNFFFYVYPSLVDLGIKFIITVNTKFIRTDEVQKFQNINELILVPLTKNEILQLLKTYFKMNFPYEEVADILINYTDKSVKEIDDFLTGLLVSEILEYNSNGFKLNYEKIIKYDLNNFLLRTYHQRIENLTKTQSLILEILSLIDFPLKINQLAEIISVDSEILRNELSFLTSFGWIEFSGKDETVIFPKGGIKNYIFNNAKSNSELNQKLAEYFEKKDYPSFIIAEFYERSGNKAKALDYFNKAVEESEKYFSYTLMEKYLLECLKLEDDQTNLLKFKIRLAFAYFYQSELKKAESIAEELISINQLSREELFQIYLMLAIIKSKSGEIDSAYEYFDFAYKYAVTDQQKIEVELYQINLEVNQGNYSIAMKKCQNLLEEYNDILSPTTKAILYNNLGIINSQLNLLQDAVTLFERALEIYNDQKNKIKASQILINLGNVFNLIGEKDKSIKYWNEALKLNDSIGDLSQKALILNNIGISYFEDLKLEKAINYYEESKVIFEKINDSFGKSFSLFNLAESYLLLCNYEKSLRYLNESLNLAEKLYDIEGQCQGMFLLGIVYNNLNQLEKLKSIIENLLTLIENHKMQSTHMQYYLYLSGLIDFESKNMTDAELKLNLAKELLFESERKYFYCKCTLDLMRVLAYQGNFESIKKLYSELNETTYFTLNNLLKAEALLILGDTAKKPGSNFEKPPIQYYSEAIQLLEDAYIGEVTWQVLIALGEEYLVKGAVGKGVELFKQSEMIIDYLANQIETIEYKNSYFANNKRKRALEKIEKVVNHY